MMPFKLSFSLLILLFALPGFNQVQIQSNGLSTHEIRSISISNANLAQGPVIVAATANSGVYVQNLTSDSTWKNLGLIQYNIQDVFVRVEGIGPLDYYRIFAGKNQTPSDSTLLFSLKLGLDTSWTVAASGVDDQNIGFVSDMDGLDFSGHEAPAPLFCAAGGYLYRYQESTWQKISFDGPFTHFIRQFSDSLLWTGGSGMTMSPVLFKSIDGGLSWIQMDDTLCTFGCDNDCLSLDVAAQNPDIVFLGMGEHVLKSVDGGLHWQETGLKNIQAGFFGIAIDPFDNQHIITFSTADTSVIYESFDSGTIWKMLPNPKSNFKIYEMEALVLNQEFTVFLATNSGVYSYKTGADRISDSKKDLSPKDFYLAQNYPNPFNNHTRIDYAAPGPGRVQLLIYDVGGQIIQSVLVQGSGRHFFNFDASALASGIYFYQLRAGRNLSTAKKMLYLR